MNCLLWNCRGLGNPATIRELVWLAKHKRPDMVFFMETKICENEWSPLLGKVGFDNLYAVDCDFSGGGRSGGLCLLWNENFQVTIKSSSTHHIAATIESSNCPSWDFCGIHGSSNTSEHYRTWELMESIFPSMADRWICEGDFNETLFHFEKRSGNIKADSRLQYFRDTVDFCHLSDLGFFGEPFTWSNNQHGSDCILERLDRVFGSAACIDTFPGFLAMHLLRKSSDHCPILLSLQQLDDEAKKRPKPFRFEAMWLKDDRCKSLCNSFWKQSSAYTSMSDVQANLDAMGKKLKIWERREFSSVRKRCVELRDELEDLQKAHNDPFTKDKQKLVEDELDDILSKEEIMWKQRSKADWLTWGDLNTGFFHKVAEGRKRRNHIREITKEDGTKT